MNINGEHSDKDGELEDALVRIISLSQDDEEDRPNSINEMDSKGEIYGKANAGDSSKIEHIATGISKSLVLSV